METILGVVSIGSSNYLQGDEFIIDKTILACPSHRHVIYNDDFWLLDTGNVRLNNVISHCDRCSRRRGYHLTLAGPSVRSVTSERKAVEKVKLMTATIQFLLCILMSSSAEAYKALVVYSMPSKSHSILGHGLVRLMLKEGNEVTYITPIEYKNPPLNLRQIDVSSNFNVMPTDQINIQLIMDRKIDMDDGKMRMMMTDVAAHTVENKNVQKLLNDPKERFDVVIAEWMFTDVLSGFAELFKCPLIWITATDVTVFDLEPNRYYDEMESNEYKRLFAPLMAKRGRATPPFEDVRTNASLVLVNSDPLIREGLQENYIPIGGFHIEEDINRLPEDLKKIMESARNGVIYFSMGSMLKSRDWPAKLKRGLLKIFGELKQTVIWKFEEDLSNVPQNVHIIKWAPQASILSHRKCLLHITHGGALSTMETIHHGVPIIAIPVNGDQFHTVKSALKRGFAYEINLSYNIPEDLKVAIAEMLFDPRYSQRVKDLSLTYRKLPKKLATEILQWIRRVVNTSDAKS